MSEPPLVGRKPQAAPSRMSASAASTQRLLGTTSQIEFAAQKHIGSPMPRERRRKEGAANGRAMQLAMSDRRFLVLAAKRNLEMSAIEPPHAAGVCSSIAFEVAPTS